MAKYLLLIALAVLVVWIWRKSAATRRSAASVAPVEKPAETMVICAVCGVHQPESESIPQDGRHYCCEAHRQQAGSRGG